MKTIYVSSYGLGSKKGIYTISFDEQTQKLKKIQQIETIDYPSYIIKKDDILFAAYKNANPTYNGGGLGSFSIDHHNLHLNNNYNPSGRSYTHLCVSQDLRYIFAANYHVGSTASYKLENSSIIKKLSAVRHKGIGPDLLKRQTGPHAHCVGMTPDQRFVYSVDLGADKIFMYSYHNGILHEETHLSVGIVPGSGPRHMLFSHDGKFAYLVNEIANNVMVFKYCDGHLTLLQVIHCIPRHFHGFSSASAIRLSQSGRHLFVSNRGHDSIALYRVNQTTGKITLLYMIHTKKGPRDFNIIDNDYLIIGCQDDNCIQVMVFDQDTEKLELIKSSLDLPSPVCIAL